MADWVHCNTCYRQPANNIKFHLTNCGHIYCEKCVIPVKDTKCKICGNRCTTILLAAKMKPDVEIFFIDPVDLWKKQFKQMQMIMQVMDFQKNHRSRLAAYNREMYSKQCSVMSKAQKILGQIKDLEREIIILKEENSYLKKLLLGKGNIGVSRTPPSSRLCSGMQSPNNAGRSNCSPLDISHTRLCPPLPSTCMPITPNKPGTPSFTSPCSPVTSVFPCQRLPVLSKAAGNFSIGMGFQR